MRYSMKNILLAVSASCLLAVSGAPLYGQGGISLDFNDDTDPRIEQVIFGGNAELIPDGGVGDSGYLKVTDANNGERGLIILPDLADPPGSALESFRITADLRVGGGTARPADGFSFNLIRPEDPLIIDALDPDTNEIDSAGPFGAYAASPANEGNLPEEGSQTGLGIGFDEWQSGAADPDATAEDCGSVDFDCVGMSIRIDNELVFQAPFPTLNGELDDQTSLQTGAQGAPAEDLGWAQLVIQVTPVINPDGTNSETESNILISYKDREVINGQFAYRPTPGFLLFGGRTGGANSNHHIDNISLVTDFTRIGLLGDFNEDEVIDDADFAILTGNMNTGDQTYQGGDIDFSGRVDLADFVNFRREAARFNAGAAAIPEPSTSLMALFGLLGLAGLRRRR